MRDIEVPGKLGGKRGEATETSERKRGKRKDGEKKSLQKKSRKEGIERWL